jgi:hypothetical protein
MIDYTRARDQLRHILMGSPGEREKFDRLILTSQHVKSNQDSTNGQFYKSARPENQGFKVYVLTNIELVPDSATRFFIECEYQDPNRPVGKLKKCFLVLEAANDTKTFGGYKVIEIRDTPPLPYRK